jgi:tRNA wybutosine-synthesizing protein 1
MRLSNAPTSAALAVAPLLATIAYRLWRRRAAGSASKSSAAPASRPAATAPPRVQLRILYASIKGSCLAIAKLTAAEARRMGITVAVSRLAEYDADWLAGESAVLVVLPTYTAGRPPPDAEAFFDSVVDAVTDFRVEHDEYAALSFGVFGAGSSVYKQHFNTAARRLDAALGKLGARRLLACADGDSVDGRLEAQAAEWTRAACALVAAEQGGGVRKASVLASGPAAALDDDSDSDAGGEDAQPLMDLEDLAGPAAAKAAAEGAAAAGPKQMMTPSLRKSLTKQGYKVVGSHSGVKLCRWTKSMLRGRGGCYKHTMYGIASHRCMEMTPSLACANKCVFCWRHHDNPVGTEFVWEVDDALGLVRDAIAAHRAMIKEARGIQGALAERVAEGMDVKHCALSLVGEPIMYPKINQFVSELHARRISTYLVTNAQFPDALRALTPVTQLYLSIDAPTRSQLEVRAPRAARACARAAPRFASRTHRPPPTRARRLCSGGGPPDLSGLLGAVPGVHRRAGDAAGAHGLPAHPRQRLERRPDR